MIIHVVCSATVEYINIVGLVISPATEQWIHTQKSIGTMNVSIIMPNLKVNM